MAYFYKGVTSKKVYQFMTNYVPAALKDNQGNPLAEGNYNGELLIQCNTDGSVARGTATSGPTPYDAYVQPSLWEQA